jgi:hypothetical protein
MVWRASAGLAHTRRGNPMKDEEWTWREIAIVVGFVILTIAAAAITLWIVWNNPAVLP